MAKRMLDLREGSQSNLKMKKENHDVLIPSKISSPAPHITIDALVASLSPQQTSTKYFDGELTDGCKVIHFVGFKPAQRNIPELYYTKGKAVTLEGCHIQCNMVNTKLDIARGNKQVGKR